MPPHVSQLLNSAINALKHPNPKYREAGANTLSNVLML